MGQAKLILTTSVLPRGDFDEGLDITKFLGLYGVSQVYNESFATIVGLTMVTTGFGSVERVIVNLNRENCKLT